MTYTFTSESIIQVDGFVYCIDLKDCGLFREYSIGRNKGEAYKLFPPFANAHENYKIICCNNPSIPVPQLPELVEDISELAKADFDTFQSESNEVTRKMGERYEVCGAYLIGFRRGHKAASGKQFTLEEMQSAFNAGKEFKEYDSDERLRHLATPFDQWIASLPRPIPSYLEIDISESGEVKILNIKFP